MRSKSVFVTSHMTLLLLLLLLLFLFVKRVQKLSSLLDGSRKTDPEVEIGTRVNDVKPDESYF